MDMFGHGDIYLGIEKKFLPWEIRSLQKYKENCRLVKKNVQLLMYPATLTY